MKESVQSPTLYLLNYADDRLGHKGAVFKKNQALQNESARRHGIENIISLTWDDLTATEFYRSHREYVDKPYHLNGFVFKPYCVLQALDQLNSGDILLYYDSGDSGHRFDCSMDPLIRLCLKNNGTLFHQWGEVNSKWTKRDCFVYMNCDEPRYHNAVALQATWFMVQKTHFVLGFLREWLAYNLDERIASYENRRCAGLPDLQGFVENRGDQSIFTNLAIKHRVRTFYGAGGPANRLIGNFVRSLTLWGGLWNQGLRRAKAIRVLLGAAKRKFGQTDSL